MPEAPSVVPQGVLQGILNEANGPSNAQRAFNRSQQLDAAARTRFRNLLTQLSVDPSDACRRLLRFSVLEPPADSKRLVVTSWIEADGVNRTILSTQQANELVALLVATACRSERGITTVRLKTPLTPATRLADREVNQLYAEAIVESTPDPELKKDATPPKLNMEVFEDLLERVGCKNLKAEKSKPYDNVVIYEVSAVVACEQAAPTDQLAVEKRQNKDFGASTDEVDEAGEADEADGQAEAPRPRIPGTLQEAENTMKELVEIALHGLGFETLPWKREPSDPQWFYAPPPKGTRGVGAFSLRDYTLLYIWGRDNRASIAFDTTRPFPKASWLENWHTNIRPTVVEPPNFANVVSDGFVAPAVAPAAQDNQQADGLDFAPLQAMDTAAAIDKVDVQNAAERVEQREDAV